MAAHTVRILADSKNASQNVLDANTLAPPFFWRGNDIRIEFALADAGKFVTEVGVGEINVAIKAIDASPYDDAFLLKTLVAADCDATFGPDDWTANTGQLCVAEWDRDEWGSREAGQYSLIISHTDPSGKRSTYLSTKILVQEDQYDSTNLEPTPQAMLDLNNRSFPVVRIGSEPIGTITGDVVINFPGGGVITIKNSARPYVETNAISGVGETAGSLITNIIDILNGNVIDFDTSEEFGVEPGTTVSNYVPIDDWEGEFVIDVGGVQTNKADLKFFGFEDSTFTIPSPFVVLGGEDLSAPPNRLPYLSKQDSTELTNAEKQKLALQWPEAVEGTFRSFVTPQEYGATGDGVSRPASSVYASLAEAQAVYPHCVALTEELDGLALQSAIDTRRTVSIPAGTYLISATLILSTQGQAVIGESRTRTILRWVEDVNGFEVQESTESNVTNFPGSSAESSSYGRLENLLLHAPASSTGYGFKNTEDASPTLWIGEGWAIDFCTFLDWSIGLYSTKAARYNSRMPVFKDCLTKAIYLGRGSSATNNCHQFFGVSISGSSGSPCPIGIHLDQVNGGQFFLQDFAYCDTGVQVDSSQADFFGGELESYDDHFFDIDNSQVTITGARFLDGTPTTAPVRVNNDTSLRIENSRQAQAGNSGPLVLALDNASSVFGHAASHMVGSNPGSLATSKIELASGDLVLLSPTPWQPGDVFLTKDATHRGGLYWKSAGGSSNPNHDDLEAVIEVGGEYVRANAFKTNTYAQEYAALNAQFEGHEDVILMTSTGTSAQTLTLREGSDPKYRADSKMMRVVTVKDAGGGAGIRNITILPFNDANGNTGGTDTIDGATSYVINSNYGSVKLGIRANGNISVLAES